MIGLASYGTLGTGVTCGSKPISGAASRSVAGMHFAVNQLDGASYVPEELVRIIDYLGLVPLGRRLQNQKQ
jgi:hypothetical protein